MDAQGEPIDKLADVVIGLALGFMLEGTSMYVEPDGEQTGVHIPQRTAYDTLAWKELVEQLKQRILELPDRERSILQHHYLEGINFDDLSKLLRLSKGRISQIHHQALRRLKHRLAERGHFRIGNSAG